jgi:hypothetical protein
MKIATLVSVSFFVAAAAVPQAGLRAQSYQQNPSITIPVPGFGNQPQRRKQESEVRDRHCADLQNREGELRERLEHERDANDRERLERQLREARENLRDECRR